MGPWRWLAANRQLDRLANPRQPPLEYRSGSGPSWRRTEARVSFQHILWNGGATKQRPRSALTPSEPERSAGETRGLLLDSVREQAAELREPPLDGRQAHHAGARPRQHDRRVRHRGGPGGRDVPGVRARHPAGGPQPLLPPLPPLPALTWQPWTWRSSRAIASSRPTSPVRPGRRPAPGPRLCSATAFRRAPAAP